MYEVTCVDCKYCKKIFEGMEGEAYFCKEKHNVIIDIHKICIEWLDYNAKWYDA